MQTLFYPLYISLTYTSLLMQISMYMQNISRYLVVTIYVLSIVLLHILIIKSYQLTDMVIIDCIFSMSVQTAVWRHEDACVLVELARKTYLLCAGSGNTEFVYEPQQPRAPKHWMYNNRRYTPRNKRISRAALRGGTDAS